jgi:hypothetical protein
MRAPVSTATSARWAPLYCWSPGELIVRQDDRAD